MTEGVKTILYPVKDLEQAKARFIELTGVAPVADAPYYVGFTIGDQHIGLVPNSPHQGVIPYWHVDDIRGKLKALQESGAETVEDVKDVGGGRLVASVKDPDGNLIGLLQDA
jgi:predicted enzyme related to lactoylglutathione lyase